MSSKNLALGGEVSRLREGYQEEIGPRPSVSEMDRSLEQNRDNWH